jgi:N-acetylmuramoyl-L-alanine amidase
LKPTRALLLGVVLATVAACAPPIAVPPAAPFPTAGIPTIPFVDGPLEIRVVHPTPQTPLPRVDSTFIYGSVGTGRATLTINGHAVPVHPNGAFLDYLPVPADGVWRLEARERNRQDRASVAYRTPTAAEVPVEPAGLEAFPTPVGALVTGGADTLATGSDVAIGRPTPAGAYRWFLPRGARLAADARQGEMLRVRLDAGTSAWIPRSDVTLGGAESPPVSPVGTARLVPGLEHVDVMIPAGWRPFQIETGTGFVTITLHGALPPVGSPSSGTDPMIGNAIWSAPAAEQARLTISTQQEIWGYKAFYSPEGALTVRLRRPPTVSAPAPLRGLRILVDPGHPPGGAVGPTGLTEAEANLAIALHLTRLLEEAGAEVRSTRTQNSSVPLADRVQRAVSFDAHLLVSVHNNAFPEGVNPFRRHGTSTYYFHPFSAELARALNREIQATTLIPDLGAISGNLALVRPTWMPSALTESVFMPIPEQEAALRDPRFQRRLAEAHVRGLEAFVRSRALRQ